MTQTFTPFFHEVKTAWLLVFSRAKTIAKILVAPLVPFLFTIPYTIELFEALKSNALPPIQGTTILTFSVALVAGIAFFVASIIAKASIFIALTKEKDSGARLALRDGTNRFFPFIWTEILVSIYIMFAYLPFAVLNFWYQNGGKDQLTLSLGSLPTSIVTTLIGVLFLIPLIILVIWLSFASLITATKGARAGLRSLLASTTIARNNFKQIAWRLLGWVVFSYVLTQAVQPLPYIRWIMPFLLLLTGAAYLVVLYKEASGRILKVSAQTKKPIRRKAVII